MHFGCCRCSALDGFRSFESWRFRWPQIPGHGSGRRQRERRCGAGFAGFGALVVVGTGSYVGFLLILDSIFMAVSKPAA